MTSNDDRMTVGAEEPINIDGIGTTFARIDSGNMGHNVLHGVHTIFTNGNVTFKTINGKIVTKPIVDKISVHFGDGNVQERPVVELDIHIKDKVYKKTLFSIADRSANDYPVLISKPFCQKAEILIDVNN